MANPYISSILVRKGRTQIEIERHRRIKRQTQRQTETMTDIESLMTRFHLN